MAQRFSFKIDLAYNALVVYNPAHMPKSSEADPIATMPAVNFMRLEDAVDTHICQFERGITGEPLGRVYELIASGAPLYDAALADLSRFPTFSHDMNVQLGRQITDLRGAIDTYAKEKALNLILIRDGTGLLDDRLRSLFTQLHLAATSLALGNVKLIISCLVARADQMALASQDRDDLFQEGWDGLVDAAKRYDPWHDVTGTKSRENAVAFSSYAVPYIVGRMKRALKHTVGTIEIPHYVMYELGRYRKAQRLLAEQGVRLTYEEVVLWANLSHLLGRPPTYEELVQQKGLIQDSADLQREFKCTCARIRDALNATSPVSLDAAHTLNLRDDEGDVAPVELENSGTVAAASEPSPEKKFLKRMRREGVAKALERLNPKDRSVIQYLFGFPPYDKDHTLKETAKWFDTNVKSILAIRTRSLRIIRHPGSPIRLRDFID